MSYFVLVYDRPRQKIVALREFADDDRASAVQFRLDAERHSIREDLDQEVVLFHAVSEEALRRTHGSYFYSVSELLERAAEAADAR